MNRLSPQVFADIYNKVPRLCVSVLIPSRDFRGCLLLKRGIEPYKGSWHLPGGSVMKGEDLHDAAARIAYRELGVRFKSIEMHVVGHIQCLGEPRDHEGIESMHNVDLVLSPYGSPIPYEELQLHPEQGEVARWFFDGPPPPEEWHPLHVRWCLDQGFWWATERPRINNWGAFLEEGGRQLQHLPDGEGKILARAFFDALLQHDHALKLAGVRVDSLSRQLELATDTCASLSQTLNHSTAPNLLSIS